MNLLVICPHLQTSVRDDRSQLIRAFIAEEIISIPIDISKGTAVGPGKTIMKPTGHFSKMWRLRNHDHDFLEHRLFL